MTKKLLLFLAGALLLSACGGEPPVGEAEEASKAPHTCYKACSADSQCAAGEGCFSGSCRLNAAIAICSNSGGDGIVTNKAGDRWQCGEYLCDTGSGDCKQTCNTSDGDCAAYASCNTSTHECVWDGPNYTIGDYSPFYEGPLQSVTPGNESDGSCAERTCTADSQCQTGEYCRNGVCLVHPFMYCKDYTEVVFNNELISCGVYACNAAESRCINACAYSEDCATGHNCEAGHCQ